MGKSYSRMTNNKILRKQVLEKYRCPDCRTTIEIFRHKNHTKEEGHKKFLFCTKCQHITNHIRI